MKSEGCPGSAVRSGGRHHQRSAAQMFTDDGADRISTVLFLIETLASPLIRTAPNKLMREVVHCAETAASGQGPPSFL